MAEQVVNRRLNIYIDSASAEASLDKLTKQEEKLVASIEKGKKAGKDMTREMELLGNTRTQISDVKNVIEGKMLPSLKMAESAVRKLRNELKNIPVDSEAAARKLQELRAAESTLDAVRKKVNGVSTELKGIKESTGSNVLKDVFAGTLLGGGAVGIAQAGISAIQNFFQTSIDEALAAEEATARFKATLDNLGRLDVFDRLTKAAEDMADSFGYLDNDDIVAVFEKLIDYGKLTEDQITKLTPVIIDFAAKQRIDLSDAASVVVKALEGNGKALKQFGIDMKDANSTAEAFGLVMTQLAPKVQGAAKTFGDTTAGELKKTQQEIANLKEEAGTKLLPVLKAVYMGVIGLIDGVQSFYTSIFGTAEEKLKNTAAYKEFEAEQKQRLKFQDNLVKDFESKDKATKDRLIASQRAIVDQTRQQYLEADKERKKELERQLKFEKTLLNRYINATLPPVIDQRTLGGGDPNKPFSSSPAKSKTKETKDEIDALKTKYQEFSIRTEEATAPILAAFRKINESAQKDIVLVKQSLLKGIITPAEAEEALKDIERVLQAQRIELQNRFKSVLNPDLLGNTHADIPVELRFEKDAETGAKDLGARVGNAISKAAKEALKSNDQSAFESWFEDLGQYIVEWAGQLSGIYGQIADIRTNAENAAFEQEVANNEKRIESARKLYESNLISEKEYNSRVNKITQEQEKREKELRKRQFERDKNVQTAQALMSAAQAIVSTLAARPGSTDIISLGAFRAIQIGIVAATTAAQVAAIRSAKPPQFERGGFVPAGPSHASGGIGLVDNRTGAVVGEVEGGEPIISRKVYAANKPLIDSLIAQGQSMSMNIPRINSSISRVFENGGFIPQAAEAPGSSELLVAIRNLNQTLASGINAKIFYGQIEEVSSRLSVIRAQSTVS